MIEPRLGRQQSGIKSAGVAFLELHDLMQDVSKLEERERGRERCGRVK